MSNPLVNKEIEFYPELTHSNIFKLSQTRKWLADSSPQNCVQMCETNGQHFYIFEPVGLMSGAILIPVFLYQFNSELYSKCITPSFSQQIINNETVTKMTIPSNLHFDDPNFLSINTNNFQTQYTQIQINSSGGLLSEQCGNSFYGEISKIIHCKLQISNSSLSLQRQVLVKTTKSHYQIHGE